MDRGEGIGRANRALEGRNEDQARVAVQSIESLIARNALALRIAANGALADGATALAIARGGRSRSPRLSPRASNSKTWTGTELRGR